MCVASTINVNSCKINVRLNLMSRYVKDWKMI